MNTNVPNYLDTVQCACTFLVPLKTCPNLHGHATLKGLACSSVLSVLISLNCKLKKNSLFNICKSYNIGKNHNTTNTTLYFQFSSIFYCFKFLQLIY